MSNITKIAPYAYLAKRSGNGTIYDLYLLVPVDSRKTVALNNVQPVKGPGNRIYISYTSSTPDSTYPIAMYKFKHWEIDSEGITYIDIHIQADGNEDLTTVMAFADADTEPAPSANDEHYFSPYLFIGKEMVGGSTFFRPSCIVLFENGAGAQNEALMYSISGSTYTITPGDSGTVVINPAEFIVNQDVSHEISGTTYTFDGIVNVYASLDKPIRKAKTRKIWASTSGNGTTTVTSEELVSATNN